MKNLKIVFRIICWSPWIYILFFYSYVLRAIFYLGYIPSTNAPDPVELGFTLHRKLIYISSNISYLGFMASISILIALRIDNSSYRPSKRNIMWLIIAFFILSYNFFLDPFFEWFLD